MRQRRRSEIPQTSYVRFWTAGLQCCSANHAGTHGWYETTLCLQTWSLIGFSQYNAPILPDRCRFSCSAATRIIPIAEKRVRFTHFNGKWYASAIEKQGSSHDTKSRIDLFAFGSKLYLEITAHDVAEISAPQIPLSENHHSFLLFYMVGNFLLNVVLVYAGFHNKIS